MPTLPRYTPAVDFGARLAALEGGNAEAERSAVVACLSIEGWPQVIPLAGARYGLAAYFREFASRDARRVVLLSAQICPLVPNSLIELRFRPVIVDIDEASPMPGVEQMTKALADAGGSQTVAAVIVSPYCGYLPPRLDALADHLDGISLVLDLAQGALLAAHLPRLMARADAVVFSFGVGKGLDVGGGLIAVRGPGLAVNAAGHRAAFLPYAGIPAILMLRLAITFGLYRHLIPMLDRKIAADKAESVGVAAAFANALPRGMFRCYSASLPRFAKEVEVGRQRAAALYESATIVRHTLWPEVYGGADQMHLRQIVRLAEPEWRDAVLAALRGAGIDALPAGEPLPYAYLAEDRFSVSRSSDGLPNARRFLADAIRLPFLGRTDERSFTHLVATLEQALGQRL